MKQVVVLIITLVIVISAGIWETSYLNESSNYFLSDISNVYQMAERKDFKSAKKECETLENNWKNIRKTWALFIDDSQMDEIGDKLISFVSYVELENDEEITHSYNSLSSSIRSIIEFESLKTENVF